jgi:hypothetical protein
LGKNPALPVFVIAEALEAIRDAFPRLFAEVMMKWIDPKNPKLSLGIIVCVTEGIEAELAKHGGNIVWLPKSVSRGEQKEAIRKDIVESHFAAFCEALWQSASENSSLIALVFWMRHRLAYAPGSKPEVIDPTRYGFDAAA